MLGYSPRMQAALALAARAHREQQRKGTDIPYIVHPVQVSMILAAHGFDEDLTIAGILHDCVEDCDVTLDQITRDFGDGVARLVGAVSEQKAEASGEKRPWRQRKEEQLAHLAGADARVAALKAADALHNAASTLADARRLGKDAFSRFNAPAEDTVWYYRQLAAACAAHLGADHPLARELASTVDQLAEAARA